MKSASINWEVESTQNLFYTIVVCAQLKFSSLFHFYDTLTKLFSPLHIPIELILRQAASFSYSHTFSAQGYTEPSNQPVPLVDPLYWSPLIQLACN